MLDAEPCCKRYHLTGHCRPAHLLAPEHVQQHALGQLEVSITLKFVTHKQHSRLQDSAAAGGQQGMSAVALRSLGSISGLRCLLRPAVQAPGQLKHFNTIAANPATAAAAAAANTGHCSACSTPQCDSAASPTLFPTCAVPAPLNALIGLWFSTPNSRQSYRWKSYKRPSVRLCGRFLLCEPSTNRLQFDLLQKNSKGASPPASKGFTLGFLRLKEWASSCKVSRAGVVKHQY